MSPFVIGAGISAGGSIVNNLIGGSNQAGSDTRSQNFAREMYDREGKDAYNRWLAENAYNHPLQQMERLRQAGLNPHLVYGKGADTTAASIANPSSKSAPQEAHKPDISGVSDSFMKYFQLKNMQAQTDNINAQTAVAHKEALLKSVQTASEAQNLQGREFDLGQKLKLNDSVIQKALLENQEKNQSMGLAMNRDRREQLSNVEHLLTSKLNRAKGAEEIKHLKASIEALENTNIVKRVEAKLAQEGILPSDPNWARFFAKKLLDLKNMFKNSID